jgi:predicted hotdog family 3-hydroxylacyl-ACP dehydratase
VSHYPAIRELVPHAGTMCLLDRIVLATDSSVQCAADSHRDPRNPLRLGDALSAVHLAEYGAQAMAVHGALQARAHEPRARARPGMLVAVRNLELAIDRIDTIEHELAIDAERLLSDASGQIYSFRAAAGALLLARGRVQVHFTS